jgi:RNA polymerase sigma factor (sigma-70 family)
LREFVGGVPGRALRVELAQRHPRRSPEEVDDAVQDACERLVESDGEFPSPAHVYKWIRITAHRLLNEQDERRTREIAVDPVEGVLEQLASRDPDPAEAVLAREETDEMEALVREVNDSLTERRREILALYVAGYKRPEIAERVGLTIRAVERELFKIMDEARVILADRLGGGCIVGEPLVLRLVYGLASSAEAAQAQLHLKGCHRCDALHERLVEWREKAAAVLQAPAIEAASPGTFERFGQRVADAVGSAKQQILGAGFQAKQQASAGYYRAVDPTPLAGARPSAVAAVIASCLTIGGGAAAYCANQGVDPIGAATGLIVGSEEGNAEPPPSNQPEAQEPSPTPAYEPSPTPSYEPAEQTTEAPQPESSQPAEKSEPEPEPEPTNSEPTAQVEGEFEPIEEAPPEPAPEAAATEASPAPTEAAKPAPVPANSPGEFEP